MSSVTYALQVGGEALLLHAERAVIWPRCRTVIVADTHFGKSGYFGRHGIAVPAGSDEHDWVRLERLVSEHEARRLVILGDFLHTPALGEGESDRLAAWLAALGARVEVHVVAGNHDRACSDEYRDSDGPHRIWDHPATLRWWDTQWIEPPFRFIHEAAPANSKNGSANLSGDGDFTLSGHVHPVARLGPGRKGSLRAPAFWLRHNGLVLPSFGSFTGGFAVRVAPGERLFAATGSRVLPLDARRGAQ
jgi:DNA ligase-associated metallophosphoesterase